MLRADEVVVLKTGTMLLGCRARAGRHATNVARWRRPQHQHLDLTVLDLDAAEQEALRLGARKADVQPRPDQWRGYLDPAGHPFCLTVNIPFDLQRLR
ncbi:MAG: VOC family protein [Actinophytocola sp.]|uniref:VOC family protein n=1 Tax=Actinophytocola sp. TaxID=1872138 RepID=UPI003C74A99C